jgi:DNA-binding CsgD family transcriptional regulator
MIPGTVPKPAPEQSGNSSVWLGELRVFLGAAQASSPAFRSCSSIDLSELRANKQPMAGLRKSHSTKLLDFLQGLYAWQDESTLVQWILEGLPHLIAGDNVMVGQHDPVTRTPLNVTIKHPVSRPNLLAEICEMELMKDHPFWTPNPDPKDPVKMLSSMMTQREWESFPMYCEVMKEDGVRDHLTVEFLDGPALAYIAVARSRRGFSLRDQQTLASLNPHFVQAFSNARLRRADGFGCLTPSLTRLTDQHGHLPRFRCEEQGQWNRLFGRNSAMAFESLQRWMRVQTDLLNRGTVDLAIAPLRLKLEWRVVEFRLHRRWGAHGYLLSQRVLDVTERRSGRLSAREREVLHWVREGKENGEIALILSMSRHTVKDHLKRIFEKLEVPNRLAAARMYYPEI